MDRSEIIRRLKSVEPKLKERGVGALFLFGSHARGDASGNSDVDLFVDPANDDFYRLEAYMGAFRDISDALGGMDVGYATRDALSPYIRDKAVSQSIRIF